MRIFSLKSDFTEKWLMKIFIGLFLCTALTAMAQNTITGTVVDANGTPLPGVNVIVQGTSTGAATDFDGKYEISASPENVIVFSYVGFNSVEETVGSRSVINVTLTEDSESLQEVVVVAYGAAAKKDVTGAVSSINSEELTSFPSTSVDQAIQGKTAGVQVTQNSGAPGSSVSVNIRGVGSFGNTTPLYVIDGFPTQDISFLNPNDIQSISVLKDASAGALYGVRASNGVVIIETKQGTKNKMIVSVDSWTGIRAAPKNIEMLNAEQFATFANNLGTAQGNDVLPEWSDPGSLRSVNWQDYAFRNGFRMGHSVSIRGGGEKLRAAFTAGLLDEEGVVIESSYKRYNVGLNIDYDLSDNFKVRSDIKYSYNESYQNLGQGYYSLLKVFANAPYLSNTAGVNVPYDNNGNYGAFPDTGLLSQSVNVLGAAKQQDNDNSRNVVLGNFGLDYSFLDGFTAKVNFSFNSQNYAGWNFIPTYNRGNNNNDNNPSAQYNISQNTSNEYLTEALLQYDKEIAKHKIGVLLGTSAQRTRYKNIFVDSRGFLNNEIRDLSQAQQIVDQSGTHGTSTLASMFARVNYSYDSKYYLTATVRRDGNGDRFGANNLYGVFPAFAASWNIDQESFMDDSTFDVLKLRASWGETGSYFGIGAFQFQGYYNNGTSADDAGYVLGGQPVAGLQPVSLANPDLKWETQVQTDIGLEGELLNRRLYFTADYFRKESSDFLFYQTIPSQTGFESKSVNGGNVINQGLELLVGYRKNEGDFTWDVSANFTLVDNEITELVGNNDYVIFDSNFAPNFVDNWSGITRSYVGGNVGTFYGYRADGIFQTQGEIDALNNSSPDGSYQSVATSPGDRKFRDINGDGEITGADREVIGSPIPDFYGGVNFNASYKNFDLGIDIYGTYGNDILNFTRVEQETAGGYGLANAYSNVSLEYYNNRWTPDNHSNTYARAILDDTGTQNNRVSDHFVEDGSFLRLRNVKLGYNFPSETIGVLGLTSAKIYVSGQNLITLTGYSGWDPEIGEVTDIDGNGGVQTRGIDFGAYPITRTFTVGVNLQF
tara:strand:- start:6125 stop:9280 length:3156 start_codon:yes stop_codon:yes gene_type:complete